ncbi:hypothetical protein STEG23_019670 [Scotinomys teguina]
MLKSKDSPRSIESVIGPYNVEIKREECKLPGTDDKDIDAANGKNEYSLRDTLAIRILKQRVPRNWNFPRNLMLGEQKPGHPEQSPDQWLPLRCNKTLTKINLERKRFTYHTNIM